jgi:hypothetical protein
MTNVIQKLVELGVDLSTKNTMKSAIKVLGIKPDNVDRLYVELKNSVHKTDFLRTNPKKRFLFLPQCLRNKNCQAKLRENGYECRMCGACKISEIKKKLEPLGYTVFVVPGGSMVSKIIREKKPEAAMGVGCIKELLLAIEEGFGIPLQGVELLRDGCVNTDVNLKEVFLVANGHGKR